MKHFVVKQSAKPRKYGQSDTRIDLYQVKRNELHYVGHSEFRYGRSKGVESEALMKLIELKLIPKKYAKTSACDWRGAGYYCSEIEDAGYKITVI